MVYNAWEAPVLASCVVFALAAGPWCCTGWLRPVVQGQAKHQECAPVVEQCWLRLSSPDGTLNLLLKETYFVTLVGKLSG